MSSILFLLHRMHPHMKKAQLQKLFDNFELNLI